MKKVIIIWTILAIASTFSCELRGQEAVDSTRYMVETVDGNMYTGQIVYRDSVILRLMTENLGELSIPANDIIKITDLTHVVIKDGRVWTDNPQATRYLWAPNGYGVKAGEAYYQNIWVFYNQFVVGVTDNVSLGAGVVPLFLFAGGATPVWITPKVSVPVVRDKFNVGAGALVGAVLGVEESGFGIFYGTSTFGSKDNNVSLGLGYGFVSGDWSRSPMVNLSMMFRGSARTYFISENYYIPGQENSTVLITLGGRSVTRGGIGIDYGLVLPFIDEMGAFFALPWLGVTVPIGKGKK